jgi:hypothetical protein
MDAGEAEAGQMSPLVLRPCGDAAGCKKRGGERREAERQGG